MSFGGIANTIAPTRGRIGGLAGALSYPSPFFDIAQTYMPTSVKHLFRFCRYYVLTNGLLNAIVHKLSEYPVTDVLIDHASTTERERWKEYLHNHHRIRAFQVEVGLNFFTYGNSLISIFYPFVKKLRCKQCRHEINAKSHEKFWQFYNCQFRLTCPQCGNVDVATVRDHHIKDPNKIRLIQWNPEDVEISYNEATGEKKYFYKIPSGLRGDISIGKKEVVSTTPQLFLEAVRQQKDLIFNNEDVFHLSRPELASSNRGWGTPLIMPVLRDTFHLQIMKKAQEAVLLEHIVPLNALFPQAGSGTSDPFCVSPDTLIETVAGLRPAFEIRQGDFLRSHRGAWRRVEAVKTRAVGVGEKVFNVTVDSLPAFPFTVSEEHPILAVRRSIKKRGRARQVWTTPEFIPVQELSAGDYVAYPATRVQSGNHFLDFAELTDRAVTERFVYRKMHQQAAEIYEWLEEHSDPKFAWGERSVFLKERGWSEQHFATAFSMRAEVKVDRMPRYVPIDQNLARLVGYYLAEGSMKSGVLPNFSLGITEHWIADEIEAAASALGFRATTRYERIEQNGLTVDVQDVLLGDLLSSLCGEGFAEKRIPAELAEGTDVVVREMLRCLFAGDGCDFKTETNRVALKMANPHIVLEARRLLLSFGFIGGVLKEIPKADAISKETSFQLAYNGEQAEGVRLLFAGATVTPSWSKLGVFREGYVLLRIAKIVEDKDTPTVIGFQMHGDRSFCVAGVATHNTTINLVDWKEQVSAEIARWRHDNNYMPIMPLPLGHQVIGGDGKSLLLFQELQMQTEHIIMGCGVPREFLQGGLSYSGTNVSLRMLENFFIGYISYQRQLLNWIIRQITNYMEWPMGAKARFKPFKMADDIQRKMYMFQLNQAKVGVSNATLLMDLDLDPDEERALRKDEIKKDLELMKSEQIGIAEITGEAQVITMKMTAKAQQVQVQAQQAGVAPGEPGDGFVNAVSSPMTTDTNMGVPTEQAFSQNAPMNANVRPDMLQSAEAYAKQLAALPPQQQEQQLSSIGNTMGPEFVSLVKQFMNQNGAAPAANTSVDMRPMPEARPPRREMPAM